MTRPPAFPDEIGALDVSCSHCQAKPGEPCRGLLSDTPLAAPHPARVSAGQFDPRVPSPLRRRCPTCNAAPGHPCQEEGAVIQFPHQPRYQPQFAPEEKPSAAEVGINRPCPMCRAKIGQPCKDHEGNKLAKLHATRQYPLNNPSLLPTEASTRSRDHGTSREAAKILAGRLSPMQAQVIEMFRRHGPMPDEQLHARLKEFYPTLAESTGRKRRTDLYQAGLVVIVGRKERPGKSPVNIYDLAPNQKQSA